MILKTIYIIIISLAVIKLNLAEKGKMGEIFSYQCLPNSPPRIRYAPRQVPIVIQLRNHVLNQIVSRVFAIYLKEILGYKNVVELRELSFLPNTTEEDKITTTIDDIVEFNVPTINLGIWMPSDHHSYSPKVEMAGPLTTGRFGWFIPKQLIKEGELPPLYPYTMFQNVNDKILQQFILDDEMIKTLEKLYDPNSSNTCTQCHKGKYIPTHCQNNVQCATLLAPDFKETSFVIHHINELKLYVNVMWLGDYLKPVVNLLLKNYSEKRRKNENFRKKFMVLHWTPSELIKSNVQYEMITMPRCEDMDPTNVTCKYEMTPLLKFYSNSVKEALAIYYATLGIYFTGNDVENMFQLYDNKTNGTQSLSVQDMIFKNYLYIKPETVRNIYNEIACDWIKDNEHMYATWNQYNTEDEILIGGIFPITGEKASYSGILPAVYMAEYAINQNKSILPNVKLNVLQLDGQCRPDIVMKAFVNYYMRPGRVLGVLGPACSETVEPIAGISKHFKMAIISYSAEGASFMDRDTYPYFFRTIGENRQYEHVFLRLFQHLKWRRVAALTEDGQKYTEYISHMETTLKKNGIELISNQKFPRYITTEEMNRNLVDLKQKNAFIIIADIYDEIAQIVMCEAYKLKMSAKYGYVWFLPVWLTKNWLNITTTGRNVSCTDEELIEVINGHFSLSHAPFAIDTDIMQEEKTVGEWRTSYEQNCKDQNQTGIAVQSEYAGYAYDAVWVYALALDKMLKEDRSYLSDLHSDNTTRKLINLIQNTDFNGVSGHIRFGEGGTRFSVINVIQWINGKSNVVGSFYPNISDSKFSEKRKLIGGKLIMNVSRIEWLYEKGMPTDGTIICGLETIANLLNIECSSAATVLTTLLCLTFVIIVSIASFMFWKRRYDTKLKQSAKLMRSFGIDLKSSSAMHNNTLDKWEIPKDRVVINRRLGEGAFGTVYGGEAQLNENGWTAVAVKTLKIGSTSEDRLDFLSEAEVMKRFDHKNIVNLLGVCLQTEPIYTIMEFMLYGDLKTFLLARRHLVGEKIADDSDISPKRLTIMALDVARALSYLAENKYVHRDIACRNCLVNAQRIVKLGDFGMTRPMFENDYYKFNRKGMLPVRWMAPESLGLGIFTPGSDVWSFGVLLYEIITFGSFPFQGMTNSQVLDYVKAGNTITIPNGVKPHLEGLMKACWNPHYKKRPTASEISHFISNYPRLVTPCLDVPLASVQMPESDSDQMDLLPGLRKRNQLTTESPSSPTRKNGLVKSSTVNGLDGQFANHHLQQHQQNPNGITLSDFNNSTPDFDFDSSLFNGGSSNGGGQTSAYNPIEPLLNGDPTISTSNLSLRRYVPMYGFRRSNRSLLALETNNVAVTSVL